MNISRKQSNEDKIEFLVSVFNEYKEHEHQNRPMFYSISLVRFGTKVMVMNREPATTDIKVQLERYSNSKQFKPDAIVVDIFTGKSRNVKAMATIELEYKVLSY